MKKFWKQGEPFVWATAAALTTTLLLTFLLLAVVAAGGLGVFWPAMIAEVELADGTKLLGQRIRSETAPDTGIQSVQFKTGNRDLDPGRLDFRWVEQKAVKHMAYPPNVFVLERVEHGNFHGYLKDLVTPNIDVPSDETLPRRFAAAAEAVRKRQADRIGPIRRKLSSRCEQLEGLRCAILKVAYHKRQALRKNPPATTTKLDARLEALEVEENRIKQESDDLVARQQEMENAIRQNVAVFADVEGRTQSIALVDVVRSYNPNAMGWFAKVGHYLAKVWELLTGEPRESNTEGGLFPAIFGTVMLIFVMAITCFPLGVLAGVYLGEYAKDGVLIRLVRIAVNNLAGIPSIVYGIFGLGFFIYGVGGVIDDWFYPELVEAGTPVFGTGGILWASLTLGLLTIPVVIVSTEEALRAIPRGIHEGSLAVGATKLQTLLRVLLPTASPGIMTGFILAMARAAGEVAPLMITGVVKLAPDLAVDGNFPFFHLDRKFMHLGFHIYDVGFQSPNVEASKPMVYVTTLLLLMIVLTMSSVAIYLRNRMRKRFQVHSI